jgi:hypothetical protein
MGRLRSALIVKVHGPWNPKQGSGQPGKEEVADGVAVSVTELPESKVALQPVEEPLLQSIPAGELVIRPAPSPLVVTVRTGRVKVTVAVRSVEASVGQVGPVAPLQTPLQPTSTEPVAGTAVNVTLAPEAKLALQVPGQEMPAGEEVMVPAPFPAVATVMVCPPTTVAVKVAVTVVVPLMVTMQVPVPLQAPDQPVKVDPTVAPAVSVTTVPSAKVGLQAPGQETPAGDEVTVPEPVPAITTLSEPGPGRKVAVTAASAESVTLQRPVPVQAPDQPPKMEAPPARAVSVTTLPSAKPALQVPGQEMPEGEEVMVPVPPPAAVTVTMRPPSVKVAVTLAIEFMVRTQDPVPVQGPDQPAKVDPALAAAFRVTTVPAA